MSVNPPLSRIHDRHSNMQPMCNGNAVKCVIASDIVAIQEGDTRVVWPGRGLVGWCELETV